MFKLTVISYNLIKILIHSVQTFAIMYLCPIRCFSCGTEICSKYDRYKMNLIRGNDRSAALDNAGAERVCCRRMIISQPSHFISQKENTLSVNEDQIVNDSKTAAPSGQTANEATDMMNSQFDDEMEDNSECDESSE